jgi:hypothetical protein
MIGNGSINLLTYDIMMGNGSINLLTYDIMIGNGSINLLTIQQYVIKLVSDLRKVNGFRRFPPPIKLTTTI